MANLTQKFYSPLTREVEEYTNENGAWRLTYEYPCQLRVYISEQILTQIDDFATDKDVRLGSKTYSAAEARAGWNLIRSKAFLGSLNNAKPVFVMRDDHYQDVRDTRTIRANYTGLSLEQQIEEARTLQFSDKVWKTLEIIHRVWQKEGASAQTHYVLVSPPALKGPTPNDPDWLSYACNPHETIAVYKFLLHEKLVAIEEGGFIPTAAGAIKVEQLQQGGDPSIRDVFFIRQYDEAFDEFIKPIVLSIDADANCRIEAVWERAHNHKIDEYILRRIKECPVVLLHIANNFNVGLEAGYALALHKPIVAFRKKPAKNATDREKELPFDIRTLHVYDYEESNPDELMRNLSEKIKAAFDELKLTRTS